MKKGKNSADSILKKHEDENEYHLHRLDRRWVIEAMEEYVQQFSKSNTESVITPITKSVCSDRGGIPVTERTPELINGNWSANVLTWCNDQLMVMAYGYIDEGDQGRGYVWANCYGDIYADAEWDDNYQPTHWMPLPDKPNC